MAALRPMPNLLLMRVFAASFFSHRDVLGCLERDPLYAKSGLLYRLYNTPRASAVQG